MMTLKNMFFCLSLVFMSVVGFAQEGTKFEEMTLAEALQKAKTENKHVFIDCYTSWCGPCKEMSEYVFPQAEVGAFFNEKFVCVKFDMEKGEGLDIAKNYKVQVYPTFIILTAEGKEQYRFTGKMEANELIEKAKTGLDAKNSIDAMRAEFESGHMDNGRLYDYLMTLLNAADYENALAVSDSLMKKLTDEEKLDRKYWPVFSNYWLSPVNSANFEFLLLHKAEFEQLVGKYELNEYLRELYNQLFTSYIAGYLHDANGQLTQDSVELLQRQIKLLNLPEQEQQLLELKGELSKARCENDVQTMIDKARQILSICSKEDAWAAATYFLTLDVKDEQLLTELKKLEEEVLNKIQDDRFIGFIKDAFGTNRIRPLQMGESVQE